MKLIDLHVHSTISDGSYTPAEVVALAKKKGLSALTLTDHESTAGNAEAAAEAAKIGIDFIPGMEMTVDYRGHELHVVAMGFEEEQPEFKKLYTKIRQTKEARMEDLIAGIAERNVKISPELVEPFRGTDQIDRYAIMRYLLSLNICSGVEDIWHDYINPVIAELDLEHHVTAAEALPAVRAAGGITSLAHFHKRLGLRALVREAQDEALGELHSLGLDGMEAYYPSYSEDDRVFAAAMLEKHDMMPTGGTDFHGGNRPEVELGHGIDGNVAVPYDFFAQIRQRCRA